MASKELINLVKKLSLDIKHAGETMLPYELNEEWTKNALIVPLLDGLGWDRSTEIIYEHSPEDIEGRLDLFLRCQPKIGIEVKALGINPPQNLDHEYIKKGLRQCKDRGASYFIWTNGDCWQFFSLDLTNAPIYQVILSGLVDEPEQADSIADNLHIIEKRSYTANPEIFHKAIIENWKMEALPIALDSLLKDRKHDLLLLMRQCLPSELEIEDEMIMEFLGTFKPYSLMTPQKHPKRQPKLSIDWEQLLIEPDYERIRRSFRSGYCRKLGEYLISEKYKPWSRSTTYTYVGIPKQPANERKKLGTVIQLFKGWQFIQETEGGSKYKRVDDGIPYLKKLLEEPASP